MGEFDRDQLKILIKREWTLGESAGAYYRWFSDLSGIPQLFPHIISLHAENPDHPFGPGKRYIERAKNIWGRVESIPVVVVAIRENAEIWVRAENPRMTYYFHFTFKDIPQGGSKMGWSFLLPKSSLLGRAPFSILLKGMFAPRLKVFAERLKGIFSAGE